MRRSFQRLLFLGAAVTVLLFAGGRSVSRAAQSPDVAGALLTIEDLPSGWSGGPLAIDDANFVTSICDTSFERDMLPGSQAAVRFQRSQTGPLVIQGAGLGDDESAVRVTSAVREIPLPCDWTLAAVGMTVTLRLTPGELPSFGDESISWRVRGSLGIIAFDGDLVWIRRGGAITTLLHVAIGLSSVRVDSELTIRLAGRADERLAAVAGQ